MIEEPPYRGASYSVASLAQTCGITRQGYYQAKARHHHKRAQQQQALALVEETRKRHKQMGTRKLHHEHHDALRALKIGRDALFELLRAEDLLVQRKRRVARTTHSGHGLRTWQNLLWDQERGPGYQASRPNEVFVADITYIRVRNGFRYLALITDAFSRKIVGYDVSESLSVEGSLRALEMALKQMSKAEQRSLIHHSDRGVQYCCHAYVERLLALGARVSMAGVGMAYENALAERVNGILKQEYGLDEVFVGDQDLCQAVREGVYLYNEERPHLSLGYRKPSEVHAQKRQAA